MRPKQTELLFFLRKKLKTKMRNENELEGLTLLGNKHNDYSSDYNPGLIETFINKHPDNEYLVTFDCPEFTSLCPMTGSGVSKLPFDTSSADLAKTPKGLTI